MNIELWQCHRVLLDLITQKLFECYGVEKRLRRTCINKHWSKQTLSLPLDGDGDDDTTII